MSRFRDPDAPKLRNGHISDNRVAWIQLNNLEMILYAVPEAADDGVQDQLVLMMKRPGRRPFSVQLTALSGPELEAMQQFLAEVLPRAKAISDDLDRLAKEAWDAGDDSYTRAYRAAPRKFVRERVQREHDPSVPSGPDGPVPVRGGAAPD